MLVGYIAWETCEDRNRGKEVIFTIMTYAWTDETPDIWGVVLAIEHVSNSASSVGPCAHRKHSKKTARLSCLQETAGEFKENPQQIIVQLSAHRTIYFSVLLSH